MLSFNDIHSDDVRSMTVTIFAALTQYNQGRNFAPESGGDQSPPPNF